MPPERDVASTPIAMDELDITAIALSVFTVSFSLKSKNAATNITGIAIYKGAVAQGLEFDEKELISAICDVIIGSALLLKNSSDTPSELCSKVASKGGTTEQALKKLDELDFESVILQAMLACTKRANELGAGLK